MIIVQISPKVQRTVQFTPWYGKTLFCSAISCGKNSTCGYYAAVIDNHYILIFFVTPGTYHC